MMHMIDARFQLVFNRVDQTFIIKIALFHNHSLMQAHVRGDNEIIVHVGLQLFAAQCGSVVIYSNMSVI